ncbi:hypothetical protein [Mesorhizobium sp.]|uniref:hypothetical protein n=1 Tax=Mesorhizobium sp. TaxID=1871066 RepID=UPI0011FC420B|nr:hypothetical protein [Mesorhizobium sp.]TIN22887.1 MAG: hypothetical protein E5Y19_30165 [Mesorhizobium sp.]
MPKPVSTIADLFKVPGRFLRSVQLEKDFHDPKALDSYIVTPPMAAALTRIADGLRDGSTRRAWRITGDYGVGKSSFALALAHLMAGSDSEDTARISDAIGWPDGTGKFSTFLPILITGGREGIVQAVARGVRESLEILEPEKRSLRTASIDKALQSCEMAGTVGSLEDLIDALRSSAAEFGRGLLIVIDELGKLLEYAAMNPDREDVFVLQRLAEQSSRSGARPFVLLGLLHQGFQAYSDRLPALLRHEWDKVAGRFEEIVFDQPLIHTAALVSGALGVDQGSITKIIIAEAGHAAKATSSMGWLSGATTEALTMDAAKLYPVHPTLLPPLVRFFSQFGQSERSLFGFLLSSEPFGLQAFARATQHGSAWYDLADFYDYVRAAFGHRLSGGNYQSNWLRIVATIDAAVDVAPLERTLLKAIGILNLLDADDLIPNDRAVAACFSTTRPADVEGGLQNLMGAGLLFKRGDRGGYRLWPNTSVNLHAAMQNARRAVGSVEAVSTQLTQILEPQMILARRHYLERGTMRYFEMRYAHAENVEKTAQRPTGADGLVVLALADSIEQQDIARQGARAASTKGAKATLVGVVEPIWHLAADLLDVKLWRWIEENTPELAADQHAAAEVSRQLTRATQTLAAHFGEMAGVSRNATGTITWFHLGEQVELNNGLPDALSTLCDTLFTDAPRITNELLNRNSLSSAAASARMRLIEGVFDASDKPLLGIDERKAPPEKSMYLSVLQRGLIHAENDGRHQLMIPEAGADPLNLRPALDRVLKLIKAGRGHRISVPNILADLKGGTFGIRDGVAPLLLALVMKIHGHELAVYEDGTYLPRFGSMDFLRLTKSPAAFELQHCSVEGVRSDVFARLAEIFARGVHNRKPVLLDVVQELCLFAAKLPDYTRKARALSPSAMAVRGALLAAREPATLLFKDLPAACGLPPFDIGEEAPSAAAERFVGQLNEATNDLQNAYSELLQRITLRVAEAVGQDPNNFDRAALAFRAARVSLAAREPRLRAFALRLRDPGLSDEAWAESLASFVVARPPVRWSPGDEGRFGEEIGALSEIFAKVEGAAFSNSDAKPAIDAVRLNLTRGDGTDLVRVLHPVQLDDSDRRAMQNLVERLPQGETQRIQILTNLLWLELEKPEANAGDRSSDAIKKFGLSE